MTPPLWLKIAVPCLMLALVVWGWNYEYKVRAQLRQSAEAAQLALKGQIVADEASKKQLQGTVDGLLHDNLTLRAAVEDAKRAAPGATPVSAAVYVTAPLPVAPPPVIPEVFPAKDDGSPVHTESPCALHAGDTLHLSVSEVTLRTAAGTSIVAGVSQAWRDTPSRYLLAEGKFEAALSTVTEKASPAVPRWGVGLFGVCGMPGCSAGPVLALPPAHVLGLEVDGSAGLGVGGLGAVGTASAVVRW